MERLPLAPNRRFDRAIPKQCQVSHHTVAKIRHELAEDYSNWENTQMGKITPALLSA